MIHNPKIIILPKVEKFVESLEQKEQKKVDFNFKKTNTSPKTEIDKSENIKNEYFQKLSF